MNTTTTLSPDFQKRFDIKNVLGYIRGGQKGVFLVELNSGHRAAVKIFHNYSERDKKEIELYQKYDHLPGIPKIIEIVDHNGQTVLVETYIEGKTLKELISEGEFKGDDARIVILIVKIIEILTPFWNDGIVHRDLKPENIIIAPDGNPFIIDFGIVKDFDTTTITESGFQPNSWQFTSPEQHFALKDQISYRTDFFSIGVIGYYLFHHKLPFGSTRDEIRQQLINKDCKLVCDINCKMEKFLTAACRVVPSERPRNIDLLLKLL